MQTLPGVGMPGGRLFIQLDADLEGNATDDVAIARAGGQCSILDDMLT